MTDQPLRRTAVLAGQLTEFDLLLAAIPLALLAGSGIALLLSVPQFVGIALGAALAGSLVGYGIYLVTRLQSTAMSSEPPLDGQPSRAD